MHEVTVQLHPEVASKITINVARSDDEAERQAKGEDLTKRAEFEFESLADFDDEGEVSELLEGGEAR